MRFVLMLFLAISATLLAACNQISTSPEPAVVYECVWVQKIEFNPATKTWIEGLDWPPEAFEDFEKIADHNDNVQRICVDRLF